jgi:hypothetical protein
MEQWAFVDARATTPGKAPLVHFDGPLQMELRIEGKPLILAQRHLTRGKEVSLGGNICTRYPGVEWVGLSDEKGIPADIHPVVDIEFPAKGPDTKPVRLKVPLKVTSGMSCFYSPLRVPEEVGLGKAKVTISFPDWRGAKVAATTLEVPVKDSEPGRQKEGPPPKAPRGQPKIEAGELGMKVEVDDLHGNALRISFDDASKALTLEGTQTAPARLIYRNKGQNEEVDAVKIVYSLKDKSFRAESVNLARVLAP